MRMQKNDRVFASGEFIGEIPHSLSIGIGTYD
jgi:hypothetical protein